MTLLKEKWQGEMKEWKEGSLAELEVVYVWLDGVYVKAGLEKEQAALLVVVEGLSDGRKVILAAEPGYRESIESWLRMLRDLRRRGMNCPKLVVGDGNLGLWGALGYPPEADRKQRSSAAGTTRWSMYWTSYPRKSKSKTLDLSEGKRKHS